MGSLQCCVPVYIIADDDMETRAVSMSTGQVVFGVEMDLLLGGDASCLGTASS